MANYRLTDLVFKSALPSLRLKTEVFKNSLTHDTHASIFTQKIKESQESGQSIVFRETKKTEVNKLVFINLDYVTPEGGISKKSYQSLTIPTVPQEIAYDSNPQWATIASIGRNTPFYNYSGSEDTLTFEIDWYSNRDDRKDVIWACRFIERLSKANGYISSPPRVKLLWGNESTLFDNYIWIVYKAPYKLSQFQKHRGMLPQQAYQEVTLKRVTIENLGEEDILGNIRYPSDNGGF